MNNTETDWQAVKQFYQACRSYKQTAAHFGISTTTVKYRALRGAWSTASATRDEVASGQPATPIEVANEQPATPIEVANEQPATPVEVASGQSATPIEVASGQSATSVATPGDTPCTLLPTLRNFTSREVEMRAPWSVSICARESFADKAAFKAHLEQATTKDCLYSGVVGMNPQSRAGRDNPATRMVAIVADYDLELDDAKRAARLAKLPVKPNLIETSFSGGTHAVWLLESPMPVLADTAAHDAVLRAAAKDLHLARAFGQLDENAFYNTTQYYAVGRGWKEVGRDPVPAARCEVWIQEGLKRARKDAAGEVLIPIDRVAREVEKRFPGRWAGEFSIGSRGVRFWDPMADNPTAAIVTETGMLCWTGPFSFRSWKDIFGASFATDHAAESIGLAIADTYYVGGAYWRKDASGDWARYPRREIGEILQNEYGLNARAPEDGSGSEVSCAVSAIATRKHLQGVLPLVFIRDEVVTVDDHKYLNTSTVRALQPASGGSDTTRWGDGFPWIAELLESLFGRDDAPEQLDFFISWLARAYRGALAHNPTRGQAIYIAGPSGCGKTFLSRRIIAPLFGGREEATAYLMGETRFNGALFGKGIWSIDDAEIVAEPKVHARYTALMKKLVANCDFCCEAKFRDAVKVPWMGRLVVTCNTDPESLRILPTLDINNADKLMFFLCREDADLNDPEAEEKAAGELPAFAAFLAGYETPDECRGGHRFGVKSFLHPLLRAEANSNGSSGTFKDVFTLFLRNYFNSCQESELRGSACDIYELMCGIDTMRELMKGLVTPSSIGTRLGQLAASGGFPLEKDRSSTKRVWIVNRKRFMEFNQPEGESVNEENCPF